MAAKKKREMSEWPEWIGLKVWMHTVKHGYFECFINNFYIVWAYEGSESHVEFKML